MTNTKRFKGKVQIVSVIPGGFSAEAYDWKPAGYRLMSGPWRATEREAVRDLASWLEENGYVHPLTHDLEEEYSEYPTKG